MIPDSAKGYSLVELLVAMSIFAVVTGLALSNFGAGRRNEELRYAGQILDSSIRRAQTSAIAGATVAFCQESGTGTAAGLCPGGQGDCHGGETCVTDVPDAWGIHLSFSSAGARSIVMFADLNGDYRYQPSESVRSNSVSPGRNVVVSGLTPAVNSDLDITFMPPKPTVRFNGLPFSAGDAAPTLATVRLTNPTDNLTREVTVNRLSGQVSNQ